MGQKPRLPRSITLSKTITISFKVTDKEYTSAEWSDFLTKLKAVNTGYATDMWGQLLGALDNYDIMDALEKYKAPVVKTYGSKKHATFSS